LFPLLASNIRTFKGTSLPMEYVAVMSIVFCLERDSTTLFTWKHLKQLMVAHSLINCSSNSDRSKGLLSFSQRRDCLWHPPSYLINGKGVEILRQRSDQNKTDHSSLHLVKVKNIGAVLSLHHASSQSK
jgi:hypothetical protein